MPVNKNHNNENKDNKESELNKREEAKREIILKAREIISSRGFKKTSTEDIAKALSKTKGSLYYYFENREDILKSAVNYEAQKLIKILTEAVKMEEDPKKQIQIFSIARLKKVLDLWEFYKMVIDEYFNRYLFIYNSMASLPEEEVEIVKEIMDRGIEQGVFEKMETELTARTFIRTIRGFDFFVFQGENFEHIEEELLHLIDIFIKGISQ